MLYHGASTVVVPWFSHYGTDSQSGTRTPSSGTQRYHWIKYKWMLKHFWKVRKWLNDAYLTVHFYIDILVQYSTVLFLLFKYSTVFI